MFVNDNPDAPLEDILAHYGVKGMKWGVHRSGGSGGSGGGGGHGTALRSKAHNVAQVVKGTKKDASGMTRREAHQQIQVQNRTAGRALEDWHSDTPRQQRNADVKGARKDLKAATRKYHDIKRDIKAQKKAGTMGKQAAKVALNKAANEHGTVYIKSHQHTTGEAITHAALQVLGAAAHG